MAKVFGEDFPKLEPKPRFALHVHDLVSGFACGVLRADPWHRGYQVPPGFEQVVNHVARKVQQEFGEEDVVELSASEIEELYWKWLRDCPQFEAWNTTGGGSGFVTRYDATPTSRQWIDLYAITMNSAAIVRGLATEAVRKTIGLKALVEEWSNRKKFRGWKAGNVLVD